MIQKFSLLSIAILSSLIFTIGSCQVVGDIFKGGMWIGAIGVILVIGLIIYVISRMAIKVKKTAIT